MDDTFDKFYKNLAKECNKEKVCERCCARKDLDSNVRTIKCDYSFSDEAKKISKSVRKILKGGPKL